MDKSVDLMTGFPSIKLWWSLLNRKALSGEIVPSYRVVRRSPRL